MKELAEDNIKELYNIFLRMDENHSKLRKNVVHALRGTSPSRISEKKYYESISAAKRILDDWGKQLKAMKKLLK